MEEVKQLLSCASLALERAGTKAATQRKLREARLLELQELLTATCRERDEAREQLLKLQQSLAEYSMEANTQQHVTSRDQSQWPDSDLAGVVLDVDNHACHAPSLIDSLPPPVGFADQFCWNSTPTLFDFDFDLHEPPTSSSNVGCSNLMELKDQPFYHQKEQQLSLVERQESKQPQEVESHLLASLPSILSCTPAVMPEDLPEPPEADLEVSQSALPERGKLLQAVTKAGPLLKTLLLTGPLPQWNGPPPALDSVEIPKISMCSSLNSLIPVGPLVHDVPNPHGPANPRQLNSSVSSSHNSLCPRTRINKPHRAALIISRQSGSKAAPSSSKYCPHRYLTH